MNLKEKEILLDKFSNMIVKVGVNLQKGQMMVIKSNVECYDLVRAISKCAYENGASYVLVKYNDDVVNRNMYMNASDEVIKEVPDYLISQSHYIVDKGACMVSISSPIPEVMKGVDSKKIQAANIETSMKMGFLKDYTMSNVGQWCVVSYPNEKWARQIFPNDENAFDKLFQAILSSSRVAIDNDPVKEWKSHMNRLAFHNKKLNDYNFKTLIFNNSLGTNLSVDLVEGHIWGGGGENSQKGIYFSPNIPTEETFTMPHSHGVNGRVYSTKPLNYQGNLIENFYLDFKNGKVINYHAEKNEEVLKSLLTTDEGSKRLGEVALISYDSPISNMNLLFYSTLFDENASCHLALGNAYTMNIKDGYTLSIDELKEKGYNKSLIHVDFMFGSRDMSIKGLTHEGKEIIIFKNGNFVF